MKPTSSNWYQVQSLINTVVFLAHVAGSQVVFPTAGVHPYCVQNSGSLEDAMASIAALATNEEGMWRMVHCLAYLPLLVSLGSCVLRAAYDADIIFHRSDKWSVVMPLRVPRRSCRRTGCCQRL